MKYGIITDIHGNLEALESVLSALSEEGVDKYICCGDIVGYGADPGECIRLVRERTSQIVAGNHDHAAVELIDTKNFNPTAQDAVRWTQEQLTQEETEFLANLPMSLVTDGLFIVHATPFQPEKWEYIRTTYDAFRSFKAFAESLCFVGHSHTPVTFISNKSLRFSFDEETEIKEGHRYIMNVGSVGQPRDGNPLACFVIYDSEKNTLELKRVEYDIKKAQEKIIEAGLPEYCAKRLESGS